MRQIATIFQLLSGTGQVLFVIEQAGGKARESSIDLAGVYLRTRDPCNRRGANAGNDNLYL
jgi:hypothetical protein